MLVRQPSESEHMAGIRKAAHLTSRNELQRSQRRAHIRNIGLQVVESVRDTRFELRRMLSRLASRRNLYH